MYQKVKMAVALFLFASSCYANKADKNDLSKIESAIKEFKGKSKGMQIPELTALKGAVEEGVKSFQMLLTKIYGSKDQVKQALKDYSVTQPSAQKTKAAVLLTINFLRFSNPSLEKLNDGLPKKSDFSKDELQKMEQASKEMMAFSEKIKAYVRRMTPDQIKYVSQDNPNPNMPRLGFLPLGAVSPCTEDMVQKIRSEVGVENFNQLASSMMLTGSSYEALYGPLYMKRISEILKKDSSEEAQQILASILPGLASQSIEQSYAGFMRLINRGEDEFVKIFGPQMTKQDARIFFQGYARKYPLCLGIVNSEYSQLTNKFMQ